MPRPHLALLALPVVLALGCAKPDLDFVKIRPGMTKKDIVARVGEPTPTFIRDGHEVFEYVAYDRYGALKVNHRSQYIRFTEGRVDVFGNLEALNAPQAPRPTLDQPPARPESPAPPRAGAPSSPMLTLRTELERLEQLKKDGLVSETEFKTLRQKILDRAQ